MHLLADERQRVYHDHLKESKERDLAKNWQNEWECETSKATWTRRLIRELQLGVRWGDGQLLADTVSHRAWELRLLPD